MAIMLSGVLILIPSLYYSFTSPEEGKYRKDWGKILIITGDALGGVLLIFGISKYSSGQSHHNRILEEGRIKGYFEAGLLPKYKAVGIQIGISF